MVVMVIVKMCPPGILAGAVLSLRNQVQWDPTTVLGRGMKYFAEPNPCSTSVLGGSSVFWSIG